MNTNGQLFLSEQENKLFEQVHNWQPFNSSAISPWFDPKWMFGVGQFDIVIGNPPYVSTKGTNTEVKKALKEEYGFADDLYSHFFFRGVELLKEKGKLAFITSKTFWTIQTKRNVRDLLLSKNIDYIFDTANPFASAMVDTCIIGMSNERRKPQHHIDFLDGRENLAKPQKSQIKQAIYCNTQNSVIFTPTNNNLTIYEKYAEVVKQLYDTWWDKICTSRKIAKNHKELTEYRNNLKAGDIALLGCLTEGGQGLATANNGKYIAIRSSTKWANNVIKSRPQKFFDAIKKHKITEYGFIENKQQADAYLSQLSETEITQLFDELKEQYGRDIFGQGYLFRLIDDNEIADVDSLTDDEKQNGIDPNKKYYVPYDKGDKDGNRWYLETPFTIAWTKENVAMLKTDPRARYQGYKFYFKEGFCWSDINTTFLKCRLKQKSINDVKSMSLYGITEIVPEYFIVSLINSKFISLYVDNFVNSTQTFQINDARQLPIIIPNDKQLAYFKDIFDRAVNIQEQRFALEINDTQAEEELNNIQKQLDKAVYELYELTDTEIALIESKVN